MKKTVLSILGIVSVIMFAFSICFAGMEMDHSKMDHSKMEDMKKDKGGIVETTSGGYKFKFNFLDMKEHASEGKTHHLMVFITEENGKRVTDAKVKYKVFSPSGKETEAMAMAMSGGFGADINLSEVGKHGIATLVKMGDKQELVKIHFEVKE